MSAPELLQEPVEIEELVAMYREHSPARVLEIGTHAGGTLFLWAQHAEPETTIVSVDIGAHVEYREARRHFHEWHPNIVPIKGDSKDPDVLAQMAAHGQYDFVFIDGGHLYSEVSQDWYNVQPMLAPGAIVAFHDIRGHGGPWFIEVNRLWEEIVNGGFRTAEIVADLAPADCIFGWPQGIGVVYLPC